MGYEIKVLCETDGVTSSSYRALVLSHACNLLYARSARSEAWA